MYRKIVVGYDGKEQAADALALAAQLRAEDGTVIAACVYPATGPGPGQQLGWAMADVACETLATPASRLTRTGAVMRRSPCPVIVIPRGAAHPERGRRGHVGDDERLSRPRAAEPASP